MRLLGAANQEVARTLQLGGTMSSSRIVGLVLAFTISVGTTMAGRSTSAEQAPAAAASSVPKQIDYYVCELALTELVALLEITTDQAVVMAALFERHREDLSQLDAEASLAIDEAGRKEAVALYEDRAQRDAEGFWPRFDSLQAAWMKRAADYRRKGDLLVEAFINDLAVTLSEKQAIQLRERGPETIRVASFREERRVRNEGRSPAVRWVDVIDLLAAAQLPEGELASSSADIGAIAGHSDRHEQFQSLLRQVEEAYRSDLNQLALSQADYLRKGPGQNYATQSSKNPNDAKKVMALSRETTDCSERAAKAVAAGLIDLGAKESAHRWLLRVAHAFTPRVFALTRWTPDVRSWSAARTDIPVDVMKHVEDEAFRYEAELDRLRLEASTEAIASYKAPRSTTAHQNYATALARMWRLNVEYFRKIHSILPDPAKSEFMDRISKSTPYAPGRMAAFDMETLEWLRSRNILPSVDQW